MEQAAQPAHPANKASYWKVSDVLSSGPIQKVAGAAGDVAVEVGAVALTVGAIAIGGAIAMASFAAMVTLPVVGIIIASTLSSQPLLAAAEVAGGLAGLAAVGAAGWWGLGTIDEHAALKFAAQGANKQRDALIKIEAAAIKAGVDPSQVEIKATRVEDEKPKLTTLDALISRALNPDAPRYSISSTESGRVIDTLAAKPSAEVLPVGLAKAVSIPVATAGWGQAAKIGLATSFSSSTKQYEQGVARLAKQARQAGVDPDKIIVSTARWDEKEVRWDACSNPLSVLVSGADRMEKGKYALFPDQKAAAQDAIIDLSEKLGARRQSKVEVGATSQASKPRASNKTV